MSDTTILELTTASVVSETEDFIPIVDVSDTTESNDGTTKKATVRKLLKDKELPSGDIVGTSDVQTLTNKTLTSPVVNDPDITGGSVSATTNVVEVLKKAYPVGCIYTSTVATNPNTLFGFGTWSEYGQGRVLVGKSAEAEFDTIGKTGGAKTHTLATTEMPSHSHIIESNASVTSGTTRPLFQYTYSDKEVINIHTQAQGGGLAHNNLQPYIVVYFWKREN
jgi:hypothetical protein